MAEVADALNLTSPNAITRIGKRVNERYRRLTSGIGLQTSRRYQVHATSIANSKFLTFDGCEKLLAVLDKTDPKHIIILAQVTPDELHIIAERAVARHFAIIQDHPTSVTVEVDCAAATPYTLYADVIQNLSTLSGAMAPNFPESFHDVLVFGAMADEYRKMEKLQLMQDAESNYEKRLSDLRMFIAASAYLDTYQGKYNNMFGGRWYKNGQIISN